MAQHNTFTEVFATLKSILQAYEEALTVHQDTTGLYYLNTPYVEEFKKPLFFGSVRIGKRYVSYHLMPLYIYPELATDLDPLLKKRKHGKSCFNFKTLSATEAELIAALTRRCYEHLIEKRVIEVPT
jgi:hypothetical protein